MKHAVRFIVASILYAFIISGCSGAPAAKDLIVPVKESDLIQVPEESAVAYYMEHAAEFQMISAYLLGHESLFESRPIVLNDGYGVDSIGDPTVRSTAEALFADGVVSGVWSLNDDPSLVAHFIIASKDDVFNQEFLYTSDTDYPANNATHYSDVRHYTALGGGWYYAMQHYDAVKDADRYRKAVWDKFDEKTRRTVTTKWNEALVKLVDRKGKLAISVTFHTEQDGLLGPITVYFDPATGKLMGGDPRF